MKLASKVWLTVHLFLLIVLCSCNRNSINENDDEQPKIIKMVDEKPVDVKVLTLKESSFNRELLANGKLEAIRRANLKFLSDGVIKNIFISESDKVVAGQSLAILDNIQQQRQYAQSKLRHKQAILDYEDQLLRLGYRLSDTVKIDKTAKDIARLRSGLSTTEIELQRSGTDLSYTTLKAPFAGKIANLKAMVHSGSATSEYFCTLIDDSELLVDFMVLEQELNFIKNSKTVKIIPFNNEIHSYPGTIISINPLVDKSGMINVKARIRNIDGQLLDGMSVKVVAQQTISKQLAIPKDALLERQGRKVVFTVNKNTAFWNYVEIAYENSTQYAIKSGLKKGDQVIYEGNFNLAHDKPIQLLINH